METKIAVSDYIYRMKPRILLSVLALTLTLFNTAAAQTTTKPSEDYNYFLHRSTAHPLTVDPHKWVQQPQIDSWESMDIAFNKAQQNQDGYGIYQLAYMEYVQNLTKDELNPKTMLYRAFEIGKANGDPYLMYWVTHLEGAVFFHYEYLSRRRHHAEWTDSVATEKKEWPVLYLLADLNDACYKEIKILGEQYLQCAYLKDETYGLLPYDVRLKAQEMEQNASKK